MKILHLFANWKWTGPAEPALATAEVQAAEHDVLFVSGRAPDGQTSRILPHITGRGVPYREGFHLGKHERFAANREDVRRLVALLREWRPDVVHCHLDNDHRIASLAVRETRIGHLVRTSHEIHGLSGSFRVRRVVRRALDGLIVTTRAGWEGTLEAYGGASRSVSVGGHPRPMVVIENGIDLERFNARRFSRDERRARLGLATEHVAVGIVARVQPHRRFDLLIDAFERVTSRHPEVRLVVIGRGTRIEELLVRPVRERGLSGSVVTTGYLSGDDYPGTLAALDAALFLVPGSDGTCRALREQMAMGLAPLVTPRPPLPEIVEEGTTGIIAAETVDGLERGLERLVSEPGLRDRLGRAAERAARRRFHRGAQARAVTAFYHQVIDDVAGRRARHAGGDGRTGAGLPRPEPAVGLPPIEEPGGRG